MNSVNVRWYVVADSSRARILRVGGRSRLEVIEALDSEEGRTKASELVTGRRGRVFDRNGPGRHAMTTGTNPQSIAKHRFATDVAEALRVAADSGEYDELVVVAPPEALGRLRGAMEDRVRSYVISEHAKDLTGLSEHDLMPRLDELVSTG